MKTPDLSQFKSVSSSIMDSYAHDEATDTLYIKFHNQRVYAYPGVDKRKVEAMASAESVGKYFKKSIEPFYTHVKL